MFKELEKEQNGQIMLNENEIKETKLHRHISLKCIDKFFLFWY